VGKGELKALGSSAYESLRFAGPLGMVAHEIGDLTGLSGKIEGATQRKTPGEKVGGYAETVAEFLAPGALLKGGAKAAETAGTLESFANGLPEIKANPFLKLVLKRIPGVGTTLDVLEALKAKYGTRLGEVLAKESRDELAARFFEENHGSKPVTAGDKVTAIREMQQAIKGPPRLPKAAKPPKLPKQPSGSPFAPGGIFDEPTAEQKAAKAAEPVTRKGLKLKGITERPETPVNPLARYKSAGQPSPMSGRELDPGKVINAQASAKNVTLATRFKSLGITPEQVQSMTEAEYEQHRIALNTERKASGLPLLEKVRPAPGRRTFAELKADIIREMRNQ
jgi:hypothetical protein